MATVTGTKKPLQEAFPEFELMTIGECFAKLGWTSEFPEDDDRGTGPITCDCGTIVHTGGWIGKEHAYCPSCHKGMQLMLGVLPASRSSAGFIDMARFEAPSDGRFWTPHNIWEL